MQISGELHGTGVIVKKPKDLGRLYSKSHFGTPLQGNKLQLDLLESVFLSGEQKLRVFQEKKEITFEDLVKQGVQHIEEFEIKYLVFRDLRKRGYAIKLDPEEGGFTFHQIPLKKKNKIPCFISVFSERDILDLEHSRGLIKKVSNCNGVLWFAIVDEEGDITYYDVSSVDLGGVIRERRYPKGTGVLLQNRVVLFDPILSKELHENEFFGKPFGKGLQLSLVEALYLLDKKMIDLQNQTGHPLSLKESRDRIMKLQADIALRLPVFQDLKHRGMAVKTGFKFGAHFRAYTTQPDQTHAEYLVHVVEKGFTSIWAEISRAVRLAHSVNKEIVFARVDHRVIEYIKFGRLRP